MLTLQTKIKNIAFAIIGLIAMGIVALNYADLGWLIGQQRYYVVKVELAQTGGLTTHAEVTYRGMPIGRVGTLHLTDDGVLAELRIEKDAPKVPARTQAVVANKSAVGEQYIDLRPTDDNGPYLAAGARIPRSSTQIPAPVTDLLTSINNLASSVPQEATRTLVDELGRAFTGQGPNLAALLDTSHTFVTKANENVEPTTELFDNSATVLATQNEQSQAIKSFGRNAKLLAEQLRKSDPDLRRLIAAGPGVSTELSKLVDELDPSFSVLLANMTTTSDILKNRAPVLDELLSKLPAVVAAANTMVKNNQLQFGMVPTFFNPLPCTSGYGGTQYRNGDDTSAGKPFNTSAYCASAPSTGKNVRGSANTPDYGKLPPPARAGSLGLASDGSALPGALGEPALPPAGGSLLAPQAGR
ncbi:mce related protein [Actinomadura rubteroloni]|uniref:Mce related protein n=1 Tax=Actinomadura rubteroloni TaxID=1926885 RepID=A0A2P4UQR8_9ACTN|nr:MlaD family protein [Actinomadura rubteroloni]POM27391.1 mce related protein [Actinomadura rubteroloni]